MVSRQRREISLFMMALSVHQLLVFYERHVFAKKKKHRAEWKTLNMGVVDADSGAESSSSSVRNLKYRCRVLPVRR